ncbi:hypothetical protein C162_17402 [Paenibacillus sp. FSL R7-269]|nr:hypothetical protein C162_17402 [Paenibacillus sp. FSL R7-269]
MKSTSAPEFQESWLNEQMKSTCAPEFQESWLNEQMKSTCAPESANRLELILPAKEEGSMRTIQPP